MRTMKPYVDELGRHAAVVSHDPGLGAFEGLLEGIYNVSATLSDMQYNYLEGIRQHWFCDVLGVRSPMYLKTFEDGSLLIRQPFDVDHRWTEGLTAESQCELLRFGHEEDALYTRLYWEIWEPTEGKALMGWWDAILRETASHFEASKQWAVEHCLSKLLEKYGQETLTELEHDLRRHLIGDLRSGPS